MTSFDENGKYIKTNWKNGDRITADKLNKIEESIEAVNDNDISRHVEADTRLDSLAADLESVNSQLEHIVNDYIDITNPISGLDRCLCDGTNETTKLQAILDYVIKNNKTLYIPSGKTVTINNLDIFNASNFNINCMGVIKRIDNGSTSLVRIRNCNNFNINMINTNGNVLNNKKDGILLNEHLHSVEIMNCENFNINILNDQDPCGDSLYINDCDDVFINRIYSKSDSDCGRNSLSVIKGNRITVVDLLSKNIGVPSMPGGIAIEPNSETDIIKNLVIQNYHIETNGNCGFQVANWNNSICENIRAYGTIKITGDNVGSHTFALNNMKYGDFEVEYFNNNINRNGSGITNVKNVDVKIKSDNSKVGLAIKYVENSNIYFEVDETYYEGVNIQTGLMKDSKLNLNIGRSGLSGSGARVLISSNNSVDCDNFTISGYLRGQSNDTQCIRIQGSITNKLMLKDIDFTGWMDEYKIYGTPVGEVVCENSQGYNFMEKSEIDGTHEFHEVGTIIYNKKPSVGEPLGWVCVTRGKPGVLKPFGVLS